MSEPERTVRASAVAAIVACLSLIALATIPRPPFAANQLAILSGRQPLNPEELSGYLTYLRRNLTIDGVYRLGHIGMWLGFGVLVARRGKAGGRLIIVLGVISGALDLLENEIRWAIAGSLRGISFPESLALMWQVTVGMSFWAMLVTTLVTSMQLWSSDRRDRIISVIGLGMLPGVCLIYFSGYLITFLWMIVWHGAAGVYLWQVTGVRERYET